MDRVWVGGGAWSARVGTVYTAEGTGEASRAPSGSHRVDRRPGLPVATAPELGQSL